jgi:hypothetical protein
MIIVDEENLKNDLISIYDIENYQYFVSIVSRFSKIIQTEHEFKENLKELFDEICRKHDKLICNNKVPLIAIDGLISVGKSILISDLKNHYKSCENMYFLEEPVSIWLNLHEEQSNIFELFYKAMSNSNLHSNLPFYFQSVVIFTRWLLVLFKSSDYDTIISERSVFSDRF